MINLRPEFSVDTLPSGPGFTLPNLVYGNGRELFMQRVLQPDEPEILEANCTRLCQATHYLFDAIRSMQEANLSTDVRVRIEFLLSAFQLIMAALMLAPDIATVVTAGSEFAKRRWRSHDDEEPCDKRKCDMLLRCCFDALDSIVESIPHQAIPICCNEGVPLTLTPDKKRLCVNRMGLRYDYCFAPSRKETNPERLSENAHLQMQRMIVMQKMAA